MPAIVWRVVSDGTQSPSRTLCSKRSSNFAGGRTSSLRKVFHCSALKYPGRLEKFCNGLRPAPKAGPIPTQVLRATAEVSASRVSAGQGPFRMAWRTIPASSTLKLMPSSCSHMCWLCNPATSKNDGVPRICSRNFATASR